MMSKSSFLVSSKENHKRRIWVWIVSMLVHLALYPGIMTVYLARIRTFHEGGRFTTAEALKSALCDAAADALGFKTQIPWTVMLLAALIGAQGFAYLYSKKKVDLYHSVPVSSKNRFIVVYINGVLIYVIPYLISVLLSVGLAGISGAMDGRVFIECVLAFGLNLLYFLLVYNAVIFAIMLAGNIFVAGGIAVVLLYIGYVVEIVLEDMKMAFFQTADYMFTETYLKFCAPVEYFNHVYSWKTEIRLPQIINSVLPFYLKWAMFAVLFGILAYLVYRRRPSEAAGNAIAFPAVRPLLKVVVAVTGGIAVCDAFYNTTFQYGHAETLSIGKVALLCLSAGLAALFCSMCMEAAYEFDVRAALKHVVSTCVSVVLAVAVFCIYYFDIFGYDRYMPQPDKVESAAVHLFNEQSYFEFNKSDGSSRSIYESDYLKENMFLTDIGALYELIENSIEKDNSFDEMEYGRYIYVLFRLESGREISRRYAVDYADASNKELLDKIVGTKEFREGEYQIFKAEDMIRDNNWQISYSNGTMYTELKIEASKLREAWMEDMEGFNFSLTTESRLCGYLDFAISDANRKWRLPVYDSFANTIACLEEENVYVPAKVRAEDVESITVINWNYDKQSGAAWDTYATGSESAAAYVSQSEYQVRETYDSYDDIERIVNALYPEELCYMGNQKTGEIYDDNYDVYVVYKPDTEYKYIPQNYGYKFIRGQVPDFVEKMTSYEP